MNTSNFSNIFTGDISLRNGAKIPVKWLWLLMVLALTAAAVVSVMVVNGASASSPPALVSNPGSGSGNNPVVIRPASTELAMVLPMGTPSSSPVPPTFTPTSTATEVKLIGMDPYAIDARLSAEYRICGVEAFTAESDGDVPVTSTYQIFVFIRGNTLRIEDEGILEGEEGLIVNIGSTGCFQEAVLHVFGRGIPNYDWAGGYEVVFVGRDRPFGALVSYYRTPYYPMEIENPGYLFYGSPDGTYSSCGPGAVYLYSSIAARNTAALSKNATDNCK